MSSRRALRPSFIRPSAMVEYLCARDQHSKWLRLKFFRVDAGLEGFLTGILEFRARCQLTYTALSQIIPCRMLRTNRGPIRGGGAG